MIELQAVSYSVISDGAAMPCFANAINGVPTLQAIEFIVERQNRVLYAFSDIETQKNAIYEMRCFLNDEERVKLDAFIAENVNPVVLMAESSLLFYSNILSAPFVEDRKLQKEDFRKIYLAYLLCSEKWLEHQGEGLNPDFSNPEQMLLKIDLPISEFKNYKDFRAAIYKSCQFFRFCETKIEYRDILQKFLDDHYVSDWRVYLQILLNAYLATVPDKVFINLNKFQSDFLNQYCVYHHDSSEKDLNYLRSHFLIRSPEDKFIVLNNNLIIDKMYQGLKFDFADSAREHGLTINSKPVNTVGDLNQDLGQNFSESFLLYDLMSKIYDDKSVVKFTGAYLKEKNVPAEPDYYLRDGDKLYLFEHKDVLLSDLTKQTTDVEEMLDSIANKICQDGNKQKHRKGGGQLLHSIEGVVKKRTMDILDPDVNKVTWIIPIVTVTDTGLMSLGVNKVVVKMFVKLAQNYEFLKDSNIYVVPITIIDIDTLIGISKRLHDKQFDLFDLITEYQNIICKSTPQQFDEPSFSSFIRDKHPQTNFDESDNQFLFSSYYEELKKIPVALLKEIL